MPSAEDYFEEEAAPSQSMRESMRNQISDEAMYHGGKSMDKAFPKQGKAIQMSPKSYYKARPSPGHKQGD